MTEKTESVLASALELPPEERLFVAEKLFAGLDEDALFPVSEEWRREIERRCREVDEGAARLVPARDALNGLEAALSS